MKQARGVLIALLAALGVFAGFLPAQDVDQVTDVADMQAIDSDGIGAPSLVQTGWRWCSKCSSLHFIANGLGPCAAGGTHGTSPSSNYTVVDNDSSHPGQHGWRWCKKCAVLFFGGNVNQGVCPAGGAHDGAISGDYSLIHNTPGAPGQSNWRFCIQCQGLWFAGVLGTCPAGGVHSSIPSGNYTLIDETTGRAVWGKVTNAGGVPVAGASVTVKGRSGPKKKTTTVTDGTYSVTGLKTGRQTVTAKMSGIGMGTKTVKLATLDVKMVDIVLK